MAEQKTVRSITGHQFTGDTAQVTLPLVLDGAVAADSISVIEGETFTISDVIIGGQATPTYWQIQQTDNGSDWYVIAYFGTQTYYASSGVPSSRYSYNTGLVIVGSATTAFRVRVQTPGGSTIVHCTLRGYSAP